MAIRESTMAARRWPARGLYLITPEGPDTAHLLRRVAGVLPCRPALVQYRSKLDDAALRRAQAQAVLSLCRASGVPLIINDDVELAVTLAADGVHLGREDGAVRQARERLGPRAIIGASCYNRLDLAHAAAAAGASYIAFGAFEASPTKPHAPRAAPSLLSDSASLGLPRVAIGGIRPENAPALVAAGADLLAVISGVFEADDPLEAARAYQSAFQESPE
jgi:thiamine-phosphate pyrophosphorylase